MGTLIYCPGSKKIVRGNEQQLKTISIPNLLPQYSHYRLTGEGRPVDDGKRGRRKLSSSYHQRKKKNIRKKSLYEKLKERGISKLKIKIKPPEKKKALNNGYVNEQVTLS